MKCFDPSSTTAQSLPSTPSIGTYCAACPKPHQRNPHNANALQNTQNRHQRNAHRFPVSFSVLFWFSSSRKQRVYRKNRNLHAIYLYTIINGENRLTVYKNSIGSNACTNNIPADNRRLGHVKNSKW